MDSVKLKAATSLLGNFLSVGKDAIAANMSYQTVENIRKNCENAGARFGTVGKAIGSIWGKVAAGASVNLAQDLKKTWSASLQTISTAFVADKATKQDGQGENQGPSLSDIAKAVGLIGIGALCVANAAPFGIGLGTFTLVQKAIEMAPKALAAATRGVNQGEKVSFTKDLACPIAKKLVIQGAGQAIGHLVRYQVIHNVYKNNAKAYETLAKDLSSYAPRLSEYIVAAGKKVGEFAGACAAMSDVSIDSANKAADFAQNGTVVALQVADNLLSSSQQANGWSDTLQKVALVAGGVAVVVLCPEVATVVGGVALLDCADKAISWFKTKLIPAAPAPNQQPLDPDDFVMVGEMPRAVRLEAPEVIAAPAA